MNWYRIAQENERQTISFDFDSTIFMNDWDPENNDFERDENGELIGKINEKVKADMGKYVGQGHKIIIVTSRNEELRKQVEDFVLEHNLPVSEIYCTNGQEKVHKLKELGVYMHFDDDKFEIDAINTDGEVIGYLV